MLVFSYGSNLNKAQFARRCPSAKLVGVGDLRGWRLTFTGHSHGWGGAVATVMRVPQGERSRVPGAVYRLHAPQDVRNLDRAEGFPSVYDCVEVTVYLRREGKRPKRVKAWTYVKRDETEAQPTSEYVATIAKGLKEHGLGTDSLVAALGALPPGLPIPVGAKRRKKGKRKKGKRAKVGGSSRASLAASVWAFCSEGGCDETVSYSGCRYCGGPHCPHHCPRAVPVGGGPRQRELSW